MKVFISNSFRRLLKRIDTKGVAMLCLAFVFTGAQAQQPTYSFQSKVTADSILIGDQVELIIQASVPEKYRVQFPVFADTIVTGIEVLGQPKIDTLSKRTGEKELTYRIKLTSFDEGFYRIPPFKLPFTDGAMKDTAQTSPIWFLVNTIQPDSTVATIYDIKMPFAEPLTFAEVAPWVGGGLLLAALILLTVIYFIKRKRGEPFLFPVKPADPPHVVALRELEKIKEQKLWETENHKHYQSVLTDIIREYIEGRYEVPAMEQTTHETITKLGEGVYVNPKLLEELNKTLSLADLVKFAKHTPSISENEQGLKFGFRFVNETKIIEELKDEKSEEVSVESEKTLAIAPEQSNDLPETEKTEEK